MEYAEKVVEHFSNPQNVGEILDADGIGIIGSAECGDVLKVWIKVANEHLTDIKYKVFGCPAAIASCSMMTELVIGKHVDDAWNLTDDEVAEALGGLPDHKYHCSNLAASALHKAIMNYVFKSPRKNALTTITILVDNTASGNLASEHGLSFWIEYGKKRVLFDTGQTDMIVKNAKLLDVNLSDTDSIVLSHGHYDHIGGLSAVLDIAPKAVVYLHPAAIKPKFSQKGNQTRAIGASDSIKKNILNRRGGEKVIWTEIPTEVFSGLFVTGQIPGITNFEDTGSSFFVDDNCQKADTLPDDQAIFFNTRKGLVVILGCAHSGVVNTLNYVAKLSGKNSIHMVIGGMHLSNASSERLEHTIKAFDKHKVQKIGLAHCTGTKAIKKFEEAFGEKCFVCSVGTRIELE